jgi:flagellar motility protein MotE (MotC chaperone)
MAKKKKEGNIANKEQNKTLTIMIALLIVVIWFAVFIFLIKSDVGGFGSGVLRPILKDVPVLNLILPKATEEQIAEENNYEYTSLPEAILRIQELEAMLEDIKQGDQDENSQIAELQAEIDRLKVFEKNQLEFEKRVEEFDKNVVFAEAAPDIEEYKKYYEEINPATAEEIYRQVVEQIQYDAAIVEYANIYRKMDPEAAAEILQTMTADVGAVARILLAMKPQESAKILAEMDSMVAAKITKKMLDMGEERLAQIAGE